MQPLAIFDLQNRQMRESQVKEDLLLLLLSKKPEFLTEMPDWPHCVHVDVSSDLDLLDPDVFRPCLNNLVGHLAHHNKRPVDIAAVKTSEWTAIVVKTA